METPDDRGPIFEWWHEPLGQIWWVLKDKESCFEVVLAGKSNIIMLATLAHRKVVDLLYLTEMQAVGLKYYPNDLAYT